MTAWVKEECYSAWHSLLGVSDAWQTSRPGKSRFIVASIVRTPHASICFEAVVTVPNRRSPASMPFVFWRTTRLATRGWG